MEMTFNELLKTYIHNKNINVSQLAKYLSMDRSTLYKIINGSRKIHNHEMIDKMILYMSLTPSETQAFYKSFYYSLMTKQKYDEYNEITYFLTHHSQIKVHVLPTPNIQLSNDNLPTIITIENKNNINSYLLWFLELETKSKEPMVYIHCHQEYTFLHELIISIIKNHNHINIKQLYCFNPDIEKQINNLNIFKDAIQYYNYDCDYEAYYYYDNIDSHFYNNNFFCCQIITSYGVILFNSDLTQCQIITDKNAIKQYKDMFDKYIHTSSKLFEKKNYELQDFFELEGAIENTNERLYSITSEPCLMPYMTAEQYKKYMNKDLQDDNIINFLINYSQNLRKKLSNRTLYLFSSLQGIKHFLDTGYIDEIPEEYYTHIELEDRIQILKTIMNELDNNTFYIVKGELSHISNTLHVFVGETTGYILLKNIKNEFVFLFPNDTHIIYSFYSYLESLNEHLDLYSPQEAKEKIMHLLNQYED